MQLFVITSHCTSKVHCKTCRNKEGGRSWRESLQKSFALPENTVDFECPHGIPWDFVPQPVPVKLANAEPTISHPASMPETKKLEKPPETEQLKARTGNRGGCGCGRG